MSRLVVGVLLLLAVALLARNSTTDILRGVVVSAEILDLKVAARLFGPGNLALADGPAQQVMLFLQLTRLGHILSAQQLVVLA